MTAILFTLLFAISGICISEVVFAKHKLLVRIWLGLTIGLLLLTWLPSLFALAIGFTVTAQILALIAAVLAAAASIAAVIVAERRVRRRSYRIGRDWIVLIALIPIAAICFALFDTHILKPHSDGSLWVGQTTYGDLAMHLGFITSIAEQTTFPPQYSIFPGHALNYPFLCETSGASLFQLGASARDAYLISALNACILVILGVYLFFEQWLKRKPRALLATVLFFFGGGFGFLYFLDLSKTGGTVSAMLSTGGQTVSATLLDGFYNTPTNIPALGLRWVNPIVDMMIPQRATLFGWAFLFPCLYLLHGFSFEKQSRNVIPLAVIAGLMPMIHTHSFLALGIVSAVYCVTDLISVQFAKKRLLHWGLYALIACALAAPQLFLFTFRQTSESGMVRFHLNWGNTTDSYLWFYIKNLGLIFLLMPFAFLILPKRDKKIYLGAVAVWLIAELIEFQPNDYDNNKLLFVWFAFTCGIVAKLISVVKHRIESRCRRKTHPESIRYSYGVGMTFMLSMLLVYFLFKGFFDAKEGIRLQPGTALTLFFSAGILLAMCIGALRHSRDNRRYAVILCAPYIVALWLIGSLFAIWMKQYRERAYTLDAWYVLVTIVLCTAGLLALLFSFTQNETRRKRFTGTPVAVAAATYLLLFAMTVSSVATILREGKSEYQVYTKQEAELSEQIKAATEPDAVILANSYHWNLITPLTGRSIVTGTGTFLFYHGIDPSERETDVRMLFEEPGENEDLFARYGVRYVLISNAERGYEIDYAYFIEHADVVVKNSSGTLLKLK